MAALSITLETEEWARVYAAMGVALEIMETTRHPTAQDFLTREVAEVRRLREKLKASASLAARQVLN